MNSFLDLFYSANELLFKACETGNVEKVKNLLVLKKESEMDVNWESKSHKYQTPLMVSSTKGHYSIVKILLEEGAKVNHQDKDGQTALMKACVSQNIELIELLIESGAEVDLQDKRGWSALSRVASGGNLSIVQLLVKQGANINSQDKLGHTTLMRATEYQHLDIVEYLLQMGADVNIENNYKSVALNYAQLPEIKELLQSTADLQEWEIIEEAQ